jgi:hypothetical protein
LGSESVEGRKGGEAGESRYDGKMTKTATWKGESESEERAEQARQQEE